jgi:hypothetical protein
MTDDLSRLKSYFSDAQALTQDSRQRALVAMDYYDSDQFTREELTTLALRGQPAITVNRIKPAINSIIGVTERGRSDPRAWPRTPRDARSADAATDILRYIADFNRFKRLKQDCFRDLLVPGSCAALVGVDADSQVTITQVRWEEFFHDPRSRRQDFKDARYLGVAKWMYADDVEALYPEKAAGIAATLDAGSGGGGLGVDQSFQDRPLQGALSPSWIDAKQQRLMVVEMYLKDAGTWRRCVFTGGDVLEDGPSPYLDHRGRADCPIEAMSAYVKRDNARYGAVWDMIGPQDEINKRRSKSVHLLSTTRIEVRDQQAIDVDADVARREAARPDGVIPYGWGLAPNTVEFQGNMEMLQEAKAEIERMGPNPAILGRSNDNASGRALLARQQSGLAELGNLYGALEDWELRIYRQCWSRAKQFWRAPQFIRVTDDEDAPKFIELNQPVAHPLTGAILGYANRVAEMDVDIEVDVQADTGTIQQEAFLELLQLVGSSPIYQQQAPLAMLIQLSPIPHKRAVLDAIKEAGSVQQEALRKQQQIAQAAEAARISEISARAELHGATGFAKTLDSLTYAHGTHAGLAARGVEAGASLESTERSHRGHQGD